MTEQDAFKDQKRLRKAELITPPNVLKQKMGSGGIEPAALQKAQQAIENNTTDFKPIATELLDALETAIRDTRELTVQGEFAIESMLYPAMQLKAQGSMFRFPLVTEVSDILVNFLETVTSADNDVLEIVNAHKMVISVIISSNLSGENSAQGKSLKDSLIDACSRYYKARKQ